MGWRMELLGQFGWNPADHWVKQDLLLNLDVQALNIKGTAAYKCQILRGQEPNGQNVFFLRSIFRTQLDIDSLILSTLFCNDR